MGVFSWRKEKRRWSRRLIDAETQRFIHDVLEETGEMLRTPTGEFQLNILCDEAFEEGRTADIDWLKSRGIDAERFYATELAPNWEGLSQEGREAKIRQFMVLSTELGRGARGGHPPEAFLDIIASVHLKVLLLAWAYDRTYGFVDQLLNGPLQYRRHQSSD